MAYERVADFFSAYDNLIPPSMADGVILRIAFSKDNSVMAVEIKFSQVISGDDLKLFASNLKPCLGLTGIYISPKYDSSLFGINAMPAVIDELKRRIPINGFLDNADFAINGNELCITLKNGGEALLKKAGIEEVLPKIINTQFGVLVSIKFDGNLSVNAEEHNKLQQEVLKKITPVHIEKKSAPAEPGEKPTYYVQFDGAPIENEATLIMGKEIVDTPLTPLGDVAQDSGKVAVWGEIFDIETKITRDEKKMIMTVFITDLTGSITLKLIETVKKAEELLADLKKDASILARGDVNYDTFDKEINIRPRDISLVKKLKKTDDEPVKRVELHCHTNMSIMDAMTPSDEIVKRAASWGMKAIAITDHGVCQGFPDAMYTCDKLRKDGKDFKIIYGVEAYQINDEVSITFGEDNRLLTDEFIVFDVETTGLSAVTEKLIEICAVRVKNLEIVDTFDTFVDPERPIPSKIIDLTGISDMTVKGAPKEAEAIKQFLEFCGDTPCFVAHNASFDMSFIRSACDRLGIKFERPYLDTVAFSRSMLPGISKYTLDSVAKNL
ncbi:MAG: PHP domain-containing protein, partial [Oscillospiraceae bacterium]|nr:PHP domain-containing protein [Oscillospiraceae bacterium]